MQGGGIRADCRIAPGNTSWLKNVDIRNYYIYCIGMYIRTTSRKNKDGTTTQYVQLAHNEWLPEAKRANAKVLYSFGRREDVNIQSLERLIGSIQRFIGLEAPKPAHKAPMPAARVKTLKERRKTAAVACDIIAALLGAEERYVDNTPENLRGSTRYDMAEERISKLQEALDALDEAYND